MSKYALAAAAANQHLKEGEYWLKKLSGDFEKTYLPYNNKKSDLSVYKISSFKFRFSENLYPKLIKISNGSNSRIFMILIAGVNILLARYTGNSDIVLATSIFKQEEDAEFINTVLALRNEVKHEYTFKEILLQTRNTIFEACENQNYPIETLLFQLGIDSYENGFPLSDVVILLENIQDRKYLDRIRTNLVISFNNTDESIEGVIEFNSELYDKDTIERLVNYMENLFINVVSNVDLKIGEIDILSDEEKSIIINGFNKTFVSYPKDKSIHTLFEEQVRLTPDNIALQYEDKFLSYSQLNERSNCLAGVLRERGIGIGDSNNIVGIMLQRSLEMVVSMLAVLKVGGTYLPIDPEYPAGRKQFILNDSGAEVLIVNGGIDEGVTFKGSLVDLEIWQ